MQTEDLYRLGGAFFEEVIQAIYTERVARGDAVIDAGASHGLHTYPLTKLVGRSGLVTAYEPIPKLARRLRRKALFTWQLRVVNAALSDRHGRSSFNLVKAASGYSGLADRPLPQGLDGSIEKISVRKTTLDSDMRTRPIRFMKMDIEGGEYHALIGGRMMLKRDRPLVVFEHGGQASATAYGYTPEQFFDLFSQLGYTLFDIFGQPFGLVDWLRPGSPWYKVAAASGSEDEVFCREGLPPLACAVAGRWNERRRVTEQQQSGDMP